MFAAFDRPWTITNDGVLSRCGWTPYDGRECSVQIAATIQRGEFICRDGKGIGEPGRATMAVPR